MKIWILKTEASPHYAYKIRQSAEKWLNIYLSKGKFAYIKEEYICNKCSNSIKNPHRSIDYCYSCIKKYDPLYEASLYGIIN